MASFDAQDDSRPPHSGSYRERRRAQSHEAALPEGYEPPPVPEHPDIPAGDPILITTRSELDQALATVRQAGEFAFDTEFIGELSYHPSVCLIQIGTQRDLFLIDPLAGLDVRPVWQLMADASLRKTVHAGLQDLEPVTRLIGRPPANVFDTQVAAAVAGLGYPVSYARLVGEHVGIELGKKLTFTRWDQRPLSAMHQRYAADDVRYLRVIRQSLESRIASLGRDSWMAEEQAALSDPATYRYDTIVQTERVRGWDTLRLRSRMVLRALVELRDQAARQANVPPRTLLKDAVLIELARFPLSDAAQLGRVRSLPRKLKMDYGERFIEATAKALASPVEHAPLEWRLEDAAEDARNISFDLWKRVQDRCLREQVELGFVTSRKEVVRAYLLLREGLPLAEHSALGRGWRGQLLQETMKHPASPPSADDGSPTGT